ncbi:MAG: UvrD-helicase domain-containing protein [Ignavibacteriales bacterium]|nr:UvrD-helicase domain-containing protein [Ignavibacteriales bacterium]
MVNYVNNADTLRNKHNETFVKEEIEINQDLFDKIEKYPLTLKQREAIVTDEDNNLIIAGAGTGKTSTLIGKVIYLIKVKNVDPDDILVLTFTKNAAMEVQQRINEKSNYEMDIKTFHKFGLDIIAEVEDAKPSLLFDSADEGLENYMHSIHKNLMRDNNYAKIIAEFFLSYLKPYKNTEIFNDKGEYLKSLKSNKTLKGELCKSHEEVEIANFLYVNDIEYEYEKEYEFETTTKEFSQYKPDFYLPKYGIYIEHFGLIDKEGNVPHWFSQKGSKSAKQSYNDSIIWKRGIHKEKETSLVETFSYEKSEGELLPNLKKRLLKHGVNFNTHAQIIKKFEDNNEFPQFIHLIITFLNLAKSNGFTTTKLLSNAKENDLKREIKFLEIFDKYYTTYQKKLTDENKIDFSDMLVKATKYVKESKYVSFYEYILIDEFQDMSIGRYQLISSLLNQNINQRLFAVGDDWQSIYRFTGSDISIITEFEEYFGFTKRVDLDTTFRLTPKVCEITQEFILKNEKQLKKNLISTKKADDGVELFWYEKNNANLSYNYVRYELSHALKDCLDKICSDSTESKKKVFIIGRYNFDKPASLNSLQSNYPNLKLRFLTAHASKGLEADNVILINVNAGKYGFPSEIADDPILLLVLKLKDEIENAEERRLFYVAMTRTRNKLYILSDKNNTSKFVNEVAIDNNETKTCPSCRSGILIKRINSNNGTEFLGCENYPYCIYTESIIKKTNIEFDSQDIYKTTSDDDDLPSGDFQFSRSKDDSKLITNNKHFPGIPLYKKNYNGTTTYVAVLGDEIEKIGINALTKIDDDWYEIPVVSDLKLLKVLTPAYTKCMLLTGFASNEKEADTLVAILKNLAVTFGYKGTIEKKLNQPTRRHPKSYTVKLNKNAPYKDDLDASLKMLEEFDWDD